MTEVFGTSGNDTIEGTVGDDTINGLGGNDRIVDRVGGSDTFRGGDGNDWLQVWRQDNVAFSNVVLDGGVGDDILWGSWFSGFGLNITMNGGEGDDSFHVFFSQTSFVSGNLVTIDAGAGDDTIYLTHNSSVLISLGTGQDVVAFNNSSGRSSLSGTIEAITITDFEAGDSGDRIALDVMLARILSGWDGSENPFSIAAGYLQLAERGNDTVLQMDASGGADNWNDLVVFEGLAKADFSAFNFGPYSLIREATFGDDLLEGTSSDDSIEGLAGNDQILGARGNDTIDGGLGNDVILGGDQNDNLYGGDGNDQVLGQRGADFLYGGAGNDLLLGGNRNDRLFGEDGNDRVFGGNDQDTISGGNGRDIVRGGNGDDLLNGDAGNDVMFGGTGRDMVYGDDGDDFLSGRGGFDVLNGGAGNDMLEGGVQADQFVFEDGFGNDTITDFASLNNAERIHLTNVTEITDFQDLVDNHMVQDGADVVISDGLGNTITLLGVNLSDLGAADFVF